MLDNFLFIDLIISLFASNQYTCTVKIFIYLSPINKLYIQKENLTSM